VKTNLISILLACFAAIAQAQLPASGGGLVEPVAPTFPTNPSDGGSQ
jgi:hypothetical protein